GGEALATELARRVSKLLPSASVTNLYGPTECTIDATSWLYSPEDDGGQSVPIGRPVSNSSGYVLGSGLEPRPARLPGGLYLGRAAVVAREDRSGTKRLVAFVILRPHPGDDRPAPDERDLRTFLVSHLPEFLVPSRFVFRESFPLTASGKTDRLALAADPDAA